VYPGHPLGRQEDFFFVLCPSIAQLPWSLQNGSLGHGSIAILKRPSEWLCFFGHEQKKILLPSGNYILLSKVNNHLTYLFGSIKTYEQTTDP
jgi:hypothetical protein